MKRLYNVSYSGSWLGGHAIVFAASPEDAITQVAADKMTVNFVNVEVTVLPRSGVVYNDCGEY